MNDESAIDYSAFEVLTFDCYGTLIDWETGLLAALREALGASAVGDDDALLEAFGRNEAAVEAGPYRRYRSVLETAVQRMAEQLGTSVTPAAVARFGGSVADWPAFGDSTAALRRLAGRYRLGVLTNCDDDLFSSSNERLGVAFEWVVTAQQVGSYKPDEANFRALLERLAADGVTPDRVLHVAQSLYHDHVPARRLGLTTVWIDRRHDRQGTGATPAAEARPNATYPSMADFARAAVPE